MKAFKFLRNITPQTGFRWVNITIHGYTFRIQTCRADILIDEEIRYISRHFTPISNDGTNRDNLLVILRTRFVQAINVISHNELVRNGW